MGRRGLFGETYSNKRRTFRNHGKFAPAPSLESMGWLVCPCCNRLNQKEIHPVYTGGFVDPQSMKPQLPSRCHACGAGFDRVGWQSAMNELMAIG